MAILPPDIAFIICEELGNQRAFGTLFNAALSCKSWARSALICMYREHTQAPIRSGELNEDQLSQTQVRALTSKWATQWKSIIMSSLGKTAYPYCLYIRSLDLGDLENLLIDDGFRKSFSRKFFAEDMATFLNMKKRPLRGTQRSALATTDMVGKRICQFAGDAADLHGGTAALEELRGNIQKESLPQWIGRLPRLRSMTLWQGVVLNEVVAKVIKAHCPEFDALTIYECVGGNEADTDAQLASFFSHLTPNTLRHLEVISHNHINIQTFISLNDHYLSLKHLSLRSLSKNAIKQLPFLKGCTAIQRLDLEDATGRTNLEDHNDILLEIISWLTKCKLLKAIKMEQFVNCPQIMTSICLEESIRLERLHLDWLSTGENLDLYTALACQTSLELLHLKTLLDDDNVATLVQSLSCLKKLKYLNILEVSSSFQGSHIRHLASNLLELEDFSVSGYNIRDDIWGSMKKLSKLRNMSFYGVTHFTVAAILDYISSLQPTNAGLQLSIMSDESVVFNPTELSTIRNAMTQKVDGRFDFEVWADRDGESSFNSDSD